MGPKAQQFGALVRATRGEAQMKFRVSKDNFETPPSGVHTGSLVRYVDLGWHKDESSAARNSMRRSSSSSPT
jgi:hypothetical protein